MRQCPKCSKRFLETNARICDADGAVLDLLVVASERDRLVGTTILGRYAIDGVLGDGGMGVVYRAADINTRTPYAVKVLRAEYSAEEDLVLRFEQEAKAAASVRNPHIVEIYDWGSLPDNSRFFVMEYLEGQSLGDLMAESPKPKGHDRREPLSEEFTLHIAMQIAEGLGVAHAIGVVHRDIKPDNFHIIRTRDEPYFVKILDFGIAKVQNSKAARTRTGSVFGTPHYMSPEQASGERDMDATTDIYGLGVLMYEMVVGRIPFDADNLMGILTAHLYHTPLPPRTFENVAISAGFEAVILKCMAKSREARYASMELLYDDLSRCRSGDEPSALADQECHTARFDRANFPEESTAELTRPEMPSSPRARSSLPPSPPIRIDDDLEPPDAMAKTVLSPSMMPPSPARAVVSAPTTPPLGSSSGAFSSNPIQFTEPGRSPTSFDTPPGVSLSHPLRDASSPSRPRVALWLGVVGSGMLLGAGAFLALSGDSRPPIPVVAPPVVALPTRPTPPVSHALAPGPTAPFPEAIPRLDGGVGAAVVPSTPGRVEPSPQPLIRGRRRETDHRDRAVPGAPNAPPAPAQNRPTGAAPPAQTTPNAQRPPSPDLRDPWSQ